MNIESARRQMIDQQVRAWDVLNARVLEVLAAVPREHFVPKQYSKVAFADITIPLSKGQQMMTPTVEGKMLQALDIHKGDNVLEIGAGTGYTAACMAALGGNVTSLDIFADFTEAATKRLESLQIGSVTFEERDGATLSVEKKYQAIAVTGSVPAIDDSYRRALGVGGRLFVVVGQAPIMEALLITRVRDNQWYEESLFETLLTPLQNVKPPSGFSF